MSPSLPIVGTRVVVRYRLPPGSSHKWTDVVGRLTAADDRHVVVESKRGPVEVAIDLITVVKAIPERPVRNRDIRNAEYAAAHGWPGLEQEWIDGWLARAGDRLTNRANSAVPLEPGASTSTATCDRLRHWYADRGLPVVLHLPDRLASLPAPERHAPTWMTRDETVFLTASAELVAATSCTLDVSDVPSRDWLDRCPLGVEHPSRETILRSVVGGRLGFGLLHTTGPVGIVRAAITTALDGVVWAGLSSIEVSNASRRRGYGERLVREMTAWAVSAGSTRVYVQVLATNEPALRLYRRIGFTEHHRYRYATESRPSSEARQDHAG